MAPVNGLRPTPRLVALASVGIVVALFAIAWPLARMALVGADIALFLAFVVDAAMTAVVADVSVARSLVDRLPLGATAQVRLTVASSKSCAAQLIDEPPTSLATAPEVARAARLVAGADVSIEYPIHASRRGDAEFGSVNVLVDGPLGLARRRLVVEPTGTHRVRVLPPVGDLDRGMLDPRLLMAELGIKPVRKRAEGTQLESLRDAVVEDDLRRMDWRATARRGRLTARNYELERNHDVLLCLDTGRLMGAEHRPGETKLDLAIAAAMRLSAVALNSGDRVGVMSFDTHVGVWVPADRGRRQLGRLVDATYALQSSSADASYVHALMEVRRRQKKRGLIVFITDFVDDEAGSSMVEVLGLLAKRHAVLFVAVRDPALRAVADGPIDTARDAYRSLAAMGLDAARSRVVQTVTAHGVRALDIVPEAISAGAISAYLALRAADRV